MIFHLYSNTNRFNLILLFDPYRKCNCNNYSLVGRFFDLDYCLTEEERNCADKFYYDTFMSDGYIYKNCFANCPLECEQRLLTPRLTYYTFPTLQDAYFVLTSSDLNMTRFENDDDFSTYQRLKKNMVQISVFYEKLAYKEIHEKPKITFGELIGTLGGHLHLFLGMSLISFVEVAEILLVVIHFFLNKNVLKQI